MSDQDDLPPELSHIPRELLKHGTGQFKDVILVPQPSDSPNDPLNVGFFSNTNLTTWSNIGLPILVAGMVRSSSPETREEAV
jgi:hypothetical protein